MTVGLTIYAFKTKTDFVVMGAAMFMVGFAFITFSILACFFFSQLLNTAICFLGVILFGFYLIYDT